MAPTIADLTKAAKTAAQNQARAQTATKAAVAAINAQRGPAGPGEALPAGGSNGGGA